MKFRTLCVGYILVLAVFLFAQRKTNAPLESSSSARALSLNQDANPASFNLDQLPQDRLAAPLVVIDIRSHSREINQHEVSINDLADWEQAHGEIPPGSFVIARTNSHQPVLPDSFGEPNTTLYSADAAQFLIEGRNVLGLGTDAQTFRPAQALGDHDVYQLAGISHLDAVPVSGTFAVLANPHSSAPTLYALVR